LAQAYIADVTTEKDRSKGFGIIGAAFGLGFIFGPAIGGTLSVYGYRVPAYTAAFISFVNLVGVIIYLPESLPEDKRNSDSTLLSYFPLSTIYSCFNLPLLGPLLILRFFYTFTFTLFETCFGFYNLQRLGLDARRSSYMLCYVGVIFSMVQGGGIRAFSKRWSEGKIIVTAFVILAFSLAGWALSYSFTSVMVSLFPLSLCSGLLNTLINSEITKQVAKSELGGTLGLSASIGSLTRVLAPISSGFLIDEQGVSAPGLVGAVFMGLMAVYAFHHGIYLLKTSVQEVQGTTPLKSAKSE